MQLFHYRSGGGVDTGRFFEFACPQALDESESEDGWLVPFDPSLLDEAAVYLFDESIETQPSLVCAADATHVLVEGLISSTVKVGGARDPLHALTPSGPGGWVFLNGSATSLIANAGFQGVRLKSPINDAIGLTLLHFEGRYLPAMTDIPPEASCLGCGKTRLVCMECGSIEAECRRCRSKLIAFSSEMPDEAQGWINDSNWNDRVLDATRWNGDDFFPIVGGVAVTKRVVDHFIDNALLPFIYRPLKHWTFK